MKLYIVTLLTLFISQSVLALDPLIVISDKGVESIDRYIKEIENEVIKALDIFK